MPTVPIPIDQPVYRNVDGIELRTEGLRRVDMWLNEKGGNIKRPGLSSSNAITLDAGSGKGVDGLFWWPHKSYVIAVCGGQTYKIEWDGVSLTSTNITSYALLQDKRVSFATDGTYVFMANGTGIAYTNGTVSTASVDSADADAPTNVSSIEYLDGYLLANKVDSNSFYFSSPNDRLSWSALDFASAAGDADYIKNILVHNRELYLVGPNSIEVWENDGTNPFSRVAGGFIENGIIAPNSLIEVDEIIYWLNHVRHFVMFDGRRVVHLPSAYDKEVQSFATVKDCTADRIEIDGKTFIAFHFPGENRTLIYNYQQQDWCEFGNWNAGGNKYDRWLGNAYVFCPDWGIHLVGYRDSPTITTMSVGEYSDGGEDIRASIQTGHIDHGISQRKRSEELRVRLKRGGGEISGTPQMMVRWKDDGRSSWSQEIQVSLGALGETDMIARIRRTGIYRTRQWEFSVADDIPVVIAHAEEDVTVLGR